MEEAMLRQEAPRTPTLVVPKTGSTSTNFSRVP